MRNGAIPATIERIADDWASNKATPEQLEYAARELPKILESMPNDAMSEAEYSEWSMTAAGMQLAYLRSMATRRLAAEGLA